LLPWSKPKILESSYSAIKHRKSIRLVTLYSDVLAGYNANEVVANVKSALLNYPLDVGVNSNSPEKSKNKKKT
jgi:hypothetical protein